MTLIRLIQRASILAGMTFAVLPVHSNPAQADTPQFCVVASNGKTACGTLKAVERACVATDAGSVICGKFKSAREEQAQGQESRQPVQGTVARKEVENVVFALKGCRKSDASVRCELTITSKSAEGQIQFRTVESTFVDTAGKSHKGSTGDLGGERTSFPRTIMTPGIDYSASITFENVTDQAVKAQLLNLVFNYKSSNRSVQFRNVAFSN